MEERNWSICFLCQDFSESDDGLSFPAKTVGTTDEKLKNVSRANKLISKISFK